MFTKIGLTRNSIYSKFKKRNNLLANMLIIACFTLTITCFTAIVTYIVTGGINYITPKFFSINNPNSIMPELVNTLYVIILALLIATPTGRGAAIYLTQYGSSKKNLVKLIDFATKTLASVPSILFGMFGYNFFCLALGLKCSILAGSLTMAICVLSTIVQTTKQALNSVPKSFQYAALAIGTSKLKTIFKIIIPCATSGILTGIILAAGRIIGESAALLLTTGAAAKLPINLFKHIFSSGQTLSLHLYYVAGNSYGSNSTEICFATATVLLMLTLTLNLTAKVVAKRFAKL